MSKFKHFNTRVAEALKLVRSYPTAAARKLAAVEYVSMGQIMRADAAAEQGNSWEEVRRESEKIQMGIIADLERKLNEARDKYNDLALENGRLRRELMRSAETARAIANSMQESLHGGGES